MQKDIFQTIPDFDKLLENQAFDELNLTDKEKILQCMTAEEYDLYRDSFFMLKKEIKSVQSIHTDTDVKKFLIKAFNKKYGKKKLTSGLLSTVLNYKLPVYQTGLAAALILAFFWFGNQTADKIKYVNTIDTVYVEKPVVALKSDIPSVQTKSVDQIVVQRNKKPTTKGKMLRPNFYKEYLTNNIMSKIQSSHKVKRGQSVDKDSMLLALVSPAR